MVFHLTTSARKIGTLLLAGGMALCLALHITRRAYVQWCLQYLDSEHLSRAIALDPSECSAYHQLALYYLYVAEELNPSRSEELLRQALRCQPLQPRYWLALAGALQASSRVDAATAAAEKASALGSHNSLILWQSGNLLLLSGKTSEAFDMFRQVLEGAPEYAPEVFSVCWRGSGDGDQILKLAVPDNANLNLAYLNFLVSPRESKLDEARKVWNRLMNGSQAFPAEKSFPYINALIQSGQGDEAARSWNQLVMAGLLPKAEFRQDDNPIVNGGFEVDPARGGLDWRIESIPGVLVQIDSQVRHSGDRSLLIQFEGLSNLDFHHVSQAVPAWPNTEYYFSVFMKSRALSSQSGPYFEIFDLKNPQLHWETPAILSTAEWGEYPVRFRTGPQTRVLVIRLRRTAGVGLDKRIEGGLWVDDVQLTANPQN